MRKKKPRTRRKGVGNMQEVIDLLEGDDDDRSQVQDKLREVATKFE